MTQTDTNKAGLGAITTTHIRKGDGKKISKKGLHFNNLVLFTIKLVATKKKACQCPTITNENIWGLLKPSNTLCGIVLVRLKQFLW